MNYEPPSAPEPSPPRFDATGDGSDSNAPPPRPPAGPLRLLESLLWRCFAAAGGTYLVLYALR